MVLLLVFVVEFGVLVGGFALGVYLHDRVGMTLTFGIALSATCAVLILANVVRWLFIFWLAAVRATADAWRGGPR